MPANNVMTISAGVVRVRVAWRVLHWPVVGRWANRQIPVPVTPDPVDHWRASKAGVAWPDVCYLVRHDVTGLFWRDVWGFYGGDPRKTWGRADDAYRFGTSGEAFDMIDQTDTPGHVVRRTTAGITLV